MMIVQRFDDVTLDPAIRVDDVRASAVVAHEDAESDFKYDPRQLAKAGETLTPPWEKDLRSHSGETAKPVAGGDEPAFVPPWLQDLTASKPK
jgi:hypothetical protein